MALSDFADTVRRYADRTTTGKAARAAVSKAWTDAVGKMLIPAHGTHIYDREWDVLIVLDACRPDALEAVADEYDFLPKRVPTIWSRGSQSLEWMSNTFTYDRESEMEQTTYVTANLYSREFVSDTQPIRTNAFDSVDEVWRDEWNKELGTVPPRAVTDRAIRASRGNPERLIVHYLQPHAPYRSLDTAEAVGLTEDGEIDSHLTVWDRLRLGELSQDEVRAAYRDQLRWVLDDVELLLKSVDGSVVITADHGELFGESGLYSHPRFPHPNLRRVPWVNTTAKDSCAYEPETPSRDSVDENVNTRLQRLGYT